MGQMWLQRALSPLDHGLSTGPVWVQVMHPWLHIDLAVITALIPLTLGRKRGQRWGSLSPWSCAHGLGVAEHAPCSHRTQGGCALPQGQQQTVMMAGSAQSLPQGTEAVAETVSVPTPDYQSQQSSKCGPRPAAPGKVGNTHSQAHPRPTESKTLWVGPQSMVGRGPR